MMEVTVMEEKPGFLTLIADEEIATLEKIESLLRQFLDVCDELRSLASEMRRFEKATSLSSQEFYVQWTTGRLGDGADFFEWYAYCDTYLRLVKKALRGSEENVVPGLADINAEKALALISRQLALREERND
jgi:hypothetical protein